MTKVGMDDYLVATGATGPDLDRLPRVELWPALEPAALHGLAGRIVAAIDPYTEADPVATLAHVLVAVGNLVGAGPNARGKKDRHPLRGKVGLVGRSGKGRKGTAWSVPCHLLAEVDEMWARQRVKTGLSSGEGLIYNVRDAREEAQTLREQGRVVGYEQVVVDQGEPDKRLLIIEPEFAVTLKTIARESNTLSGMLRQAWDSGDLSTLTRNNPLRATGAHISVIGHITEEELRRNLTETERANGFANRFLWLLVRRSKILPEGAAMPEAALARLVAELRAVVAFAAGAGQVVRDEAARALWAELYPGLSEGQPGMLGAILSRAEAQVLRLSALYAVLDRSAVVRPAHLEAGLTVWRYAEASARRIFGGLLGSPMADTILEGLRARGPMAETAIHGLLGKHQSSADIQAVLRELEGSGRVRCRVEATGGRPARVWEVVF
jgi:hypothetical protein